MQLFKVFIAQNGRFEKEKMFLSSCNKRIGINLPDMAPKYHILTLYTDLVTWFNDHTIGLSRQGITKMDHFCQAAWYDKYLGVGSDTDQPAYDLGCHTERCVIVYNQYVTIGSVVR